MIVSYDCRIAFSLLINLAKSYNSSTAFTASYLACKLNFPLENVLKIFGSLEKGEMIVTNLQAENIDFTLEGSQNSSEHHNSLKQGFISDFMIPKNTAASAKNKIVDTPYSLLKDPAKITLAEIITIIGESLKMTSCGFCAALCQTTSLNNKCPTHMLWKNFGSYLESYFKNITLKALCEGDFKISAIH